MRLLDLIATLSLPRLLRLMLALPLLALPAFAEMPKPDPDRGAQEFRRCRSCHRIEAPDGQVIENGGRTGPNLWGVVGRRVASAEGYAYGAGIKQLAEAGMIWDQSLLAEYLADPSAFITAYGGRGPSKMVFKLSRGGADMAAFLARATHVAAPQGE